MQITFDTENLSPLDYKVLAVLGGVATAPADEAEAAVSAPAPKKAAPAAKKAAPKAEKAAPEPETEEEPEEEPEAEADEDLVGGDGPTMEDAVAAATKLVSSGQAAKVKAALGEVGAKKVSEVKAEDLATFVNALS